MTAQATLNEIRREMRHAVNFRTLGESRARGEFPVQMANISLNGFMAAGGVDVIPGERLVIRLPKVGRIEAHVVWCAGGRAGFLFERIIRFDDFETLLEALRAPQGAGGVYERGGGYGAIAAPSQPNTRPLSAGVRPSSTASSREAA